MNIAHRIVKTQPVLMVTTSNFEYLKTQLNHSIHEKGHLRSRNDLSPSQLNPSPTAPNFTMSDPTNSMCPNFTKEADRITHTTGENNQKLLMRLN